MSFLEIGPPELEFDGTELSLQNESEKVTAAARWLEEAGIDTLGFVLYEVEHRLDHPRRSKYLPMVGDAFL